MDYTKTVQFLKTFSPDGPYILGFIPVTGGSLKSKYFDNLRDIPEWCEANNVGHGLYYHVGKPREGVKARMKKYQVASLEWLWVDVDPEKGAKFEDERVRILKLLRGIPPQGVPCKPNILVDSGGGYQALWKLTKPIILESPDDILEAERLTRFLVQAYGGDRQATSVDNLLRLPGTTNHPNAKKKELGRESAPTSCVLLHKEPYPGGSFGKAEKVIEDSGEEPDVDVEGRVNTYTADNLPDGLGSKWESILVDCEKSFYYEDTGYDSRSELLFGAVRFMLSKGFSHQVIYDILLSPSLGISAHVLEQHDVDRCAKRQISRMVMKMKTPEVNEKTAADMSFVFSTHPKTGLETIIPTMLHNIRLAILKEGIQCSYNELGVVALYNGENFQNYHVTQARCALENRFGVTFGQNITDQMIESMCHENSYHPVRTYFDELPAWDGTVRLDTWLMDYCGAEDNALNRAYGRLTLLAAAKRILEPGCKFDEMLILEGHQGDGKSDLIRKGLCPNPKWFTDNLRLHCNQQEFMEAIIGHWIVECPELDGMRKSNTEKLKALLSRTVDKARMSYDKNRTDRPRQFIIFGTTNRDDYLVDVTGNRRFWPVKCSGDLNARIADLARARKQIWAEAKAAVEDGERIRLDPALYKLSGIRAQERLEDNPVEDRLASSIGGQDGVLRMPEILDYFGYKAADRGAIMTVSGALRRLGFERKQLSFDGQAVRVWQKGDSKDWIELTFDDAKEVM